jgi:ApaG protein
MTRAVTEGVEISVETKFLDDHSDPMERFYFFLYTITIENKNDFTIQLQKRHWYIFDSNGDRREVEGEGVVGEKPVLEPGGKYTYSSGCNLATELGKMRGTYSMLRLLDGKKFEVNIPEFYLEAPQKLN